MIKIAVGGGLLIMAAVWWFQRCLLYLPDTTVPPSAASVLPGSQEVTFTTGDGVQLAGWLLLAPGGTSRGTVLVFNGNAGNRSHRAPLAAALAGEGLSVPLFDYRGFGGNSGTPSEAGLFADARAARNYLLTRPDVDATRLIYYGESLGTSLAVGLAAEEPPAALILRSPYTSMVDVGRRHYWFLPVQFLLMDRFPAIDWIRRVPVPTLVIAGADDQLIPPEMSQRLFDAAPGPKQFVSIPGANHADARLGMGTEVLDTLWQFLTTTAGSRFR